MTREEEDLRVREIEAWMRDGEIRIIRRGGETRYIDILVEYVPPDPRDRGKMRTDPGNVVK